MLVATGSVQLFDRLSDVALQNELMGESRAVLDSIALLQSLGRAESSLAAADGQTPGHVRYLCRSISS